LTCPVCNADTKIIDSRKNNDHVIRYRRCKECDYRFPTIEVDGDIYRSQRTPVVDLDLKKFISALKKITSDMEDKYD
jgi:transcriptional regulator NrdR family protein